MIDFLKRLFGGATAPDTQLMQPIKTAKKPPIPADVLAEFQEWFLAQRRPAVALIPDPTGIVGQRGSRLGGPAWLAEGEAWPMDKDGVPLEFVAQLDLADRATLGIGPTEGMVQFFVGRDDFHGANFDDLLSGNFQISVHSYDAAGALHPQPPLINFNGKKGSDYSPFQSDHVREHGLPLISEPFDDKADVGLVEISARFNDLYEKYDATALWEFIESDAALRQQNHHTGGYPAYTQSDIRHEVKWADYGHVLLRVTSDNAIMWGDAGEAVFLIRPTDLERGDFSKVLYSWDCS